MPSWHLADAQGSGIITEPNTDLRPKPQKPQRC